MKIDWEKWQKFWDDSMELIPGDICLYCKKSVLEYSPETDWHSEELICPKCFSDYAFYIEESTMFGYNAT